jgi:hypothetical protein
MFVLLHILAATTPKMREVIPASDKPVWVLAESRGNTKQIVWKSRKHGSIHHRSHSGR